MIAKIISPHQTLSLNSHLLGYFENGLNSTIPPSNCPKNLSSLLQNNLISGILNNTIARRSRPRPKAQPGWVRPAFVIIEGWITPEPRTSSHSSLKYISSSHEGSTRVRLRVRTQDKIYHRYFRSLTSKRKIISIPPHLNIPE